MLLMLFKRFLGLRSPQSEVEDSRIEDTIVQIQEGNAQLLNQVITDYQPYIAKAASRFCKRYVEPSRDEEFAIAMHAFHEAIEQFAPKEGRSFLGFADMVIRRRLIDYVRKESRHHGQLSYQAFEREDDEGHADNVADIHQAMERYEQEKIAEERRAEIVEFSRELSLFDIQFEELPRVSPKHADSRAMMFHMARIISQDPDMLGTLLSKRTMPIKELLAKTKVSRKTIERNRKYLIALTLIYAGHYPYLMDYLRLPPEEHAGATGKEGGV